MTPETSDHTRGPWEIVCEPGVRTGWALRIDEVPLDRDDDTDTAAADDDDTITRTYASTLLEVEQAIADRVDTYGDAVARIVHTFGGRDIHLRDGTRIEFRWELVLSDWRCSDCGVDTDAINEYYMVLDDIWDQATRGLDGHLCIECLERRLGRTLRAPDFSSRDVNTNADMPRSPRLTARLH